MAPPPTFVEGCGVCCMVLFGILLMAFRLTLSIYAAVYASQHLQVADCGQLFAFYLVYAILGLVVLVLGCGTHQVQNGESGGCGSCMYFLCAATLFCWTMYGGSIIYNPSHPPCYDQHGVDTFMLVTFWYDISGLIVILPLITCVMCCIATQRQ